jgi:hypothetical protein
VFLFFWFLFSTNSIPNWTSWMRFFSVNFRYDAVHLYFFIRRNPKARFTLNCWQK